MALYDVALLVLSVAVAVWYATYCTTGHGIMWDVEEKEEEREENRK